MLYNSDFKFFTRASELAKNGEHRVRVGCIAVYKNTPISGAWNTIRNTSPVKFSDISVHAEIACANLVSDRLITGVTLYIARLNKADELMPSHPCARCISVLKDLNIKSICYLREDMKIVKKSIKLY